MFRWRKQGTLKRFAQIRFTQKLGRLKSRLRNSGRKVVKYLREQGWLETQWGCLVGTHRFQVRKGHWGCQNQSWDAGAGSWQSPTSLPGKRTMLGGGEWGLLAPSSPGILPCCCLSRPHQPSLQPHDLVRALLRFSVFAFPSRLKMTSQSSLASMVCPDAWLKPIPPSKNTGNHHVQLFTQWRCLSQFLIFKAVMWVIS